MERRVGDSGEIERMPRLEYVVERMKIPRSGFLPSEKDNVLTFDSPGPEFVRCFRRHLPLVRAALRCILY
jgi:hypothetical protein